MKHLGDITKISGYDVPPVDVVIGGSPCQDLSIAGKRDGLSGERSGLFMEQIRIIKEMRDADVKRGRSGVFIRPRFMVWENVPGAFSSNKGQDFRKVLEETIRIAEPDAPDIPLLKKWPLADSYYGDGWSVAYRVLDAQFWGVPQRRRRIALVADFGGHAAPEILFIRKGVCGNFAESGTQRKEVAARIGDGVDSASAYGETGVGYWQTGIQTLRAEGENRPSRPSNVVVCLNDQGGSIMSTSEDVSGTLRAQEHGHQPIVAIPINTMVATRDNEESRTTFGVGEDGDPQFTISDAHCHGVYTAGFKPHAGAKSGSVAYEEEVSPTLDTGKPMAVYDARGNGNGETVPTLTGDHQNRVTDYTAIVAHPLLAKANNSFRADMGTYPITNGIARRLTPLECERLQGYPDGWTDVGAWADSTGKLHKESSDSARYKTLGNSIALPPWAWVLKRISACYERPATMASLFDGIGGFPLIWTRLNGKDSVKWVSEIEEFPIAVTKYHFVDNRRG